MRLVLLLILALTMPIAARGELEDCSSEVRITLGKRETKAVDSQLLAEVKRAMSENRADIQQIRVQLDKLINPAVRESSALQCVELEKIVAEWKLDVRSLRGKLDSVEKQLLLSQAERKIENKAENKSEAEFPQQVNCSKASKLALVTLNNVTYYFQSSPMVTNIAIIVNCTQKNAFSLQMNWNSAKQFCEDHGMSLATPNSQAELTAMHKHAKSLSGSLLLWVSASDVGPQAGHFQWLNGTDLPLTSELWLKGQPDEYKSGKTCVYFLTYANYVDKLADHTCIAIMAFVCQLRPNCSTID
ncbi:Hypothetical predicted protein [Cloeon dipterum]|uniref:C-type lectin domain-containing protein n=1 Tax=Cloeon dipterum TaxID=197152 RepID=A0A8S1CXZ5_9INSE|nr:Hypothetical predicted protein [Cloeon dipterum]